MRPDAHYMGVARSVALASPDRSTKVGCVIVDGHGLIRMTGFNDFPRGVDKSAEDRHERPAKYKWTEHAERNAIYSAARAGVPIGGCKMFLPWFPCMECARAIVQSGISQIVCEQPDLTDKRWGADFNLASRLFAEAGVEVRFVAGA